MNAPQDPTEPLPAEGRTDSGIDARRARVGLFVSITLLALAVSAIAAIFIATRKPLAASASLASSSPVAPIATVEWSPVPDAGPGTRPDAGSNEEAGATAGDRPAGGSDAGATLDSGGTAADVAIRRGKVTSNTAVITALTRLGLSASDAQQVIAALDGIFDFRRARPGQTFELQFERATRKPLYFRYDASLTEVYEVRRAGGTLVGQRKHIPTRIEIKRFGGTVARSLYRALDRLGAHPSLTGRIMEVLSSQVDFYREQRPGDTFRVLVEEESLDGTFLGYEPVLALEYSSVRSGRKRFFRFEPPGSDPAYYDESGVSLPRSVISIPVHYTRISSPFGVRFHPILKQRKLHNGVDFAAGAGAQVWACQDGRVTVAERRGANGNLVVIEHDDGLVSYYAHLSRFASGIRPGTEVKERQVIGFVGSTGRSTGPHLHFGLKKNGRFLDPLVYKIRPGAPPPTRHRPALKKLIEERGEMLDRILIQPPAEPLGRAPREEPEVLGVEDIE